MLEIFKTPTSTGGTLTILVLCVFCLFFLFTYQSLTDSLTGNAMHEHDFHWILKGEVLTATAKMSLKPKKSIAFLPPQPLSFDEATDYADMMIEQKRRRALVNKACTASNMSREMDLDRKGGVFKSVGHLLVDDKYKILFGFIPKVGCTTWKGVIGRLRGKHKGDLSETKTLLGFGSNHSEITYRVENYRKVLFVREPITRMLSGYLSKLKNHARLQRFWEGYIGRNIVKRYRGYDHEERYRDEKIKPWMNITLSEYIQYITDRGSDIVMDVLNDHWLPLNVVSNPCQIRYDFIGHYENLAVEAPFALRWLGIDHLIQFPPVHQSHASEALIEEYSQVPLHLLKRLSVYYGFDYKAFGYHVNDTISLLMKGIFKDEFDEDIGDE